MTWTAPFMVSNESGTVNTVVYATLVAPAGSPFRIETAPPSSAQPNGGAGQP